MKKTFMLCMLILVSSTTHAGSQPAKSAVGFSTVEEARTSLKIKPDVTFTTTKQDGWLVANEQSPFTVWSFTPQGHYAYPAVVKRELKQNSSGGVFIETSALCEADKHSCDRLMNEFRILNATVQEKITSEVGK